MIGLLVGSKPIRSNVTVLTTSFFTHFVLSQIHDDRSQGAFFEQVTSFAVCYEVIYHPSIFEDVGVDSPGK